MNLQMELLEKHIFELEQELFTLVYKARVAMKSIKYIKEVTIIQEERSGHFHLWLLPRYEWMDDKFENSLSSVRECMKYAKINYKSEENTKAILETVKIIKGNFIGV